MAPLQPYVALSYKNISQNKEHIPFSLTENCCLIFQEMLILKEELGYMFYTKYYRNLY